MRFGLSLLLTLASFRLLAQLVLPEASGWTSVEEGKLVSFTVGVADNKYSARFSLEGGQEFGMQLDTLGHFSWTPSYEIADRLARQKEVSVIFQADSRDGKRIRQPVNFTVLHVNRAPVVSELPVFYVRQGVPNKFLIASGFIEDPDEDPVVIKARASQMPEGAELSSVGELSWTPSRSQFAGLKGEGRWIEFAVQDQPDKLETTGKIRVAQTQLDLPPELMLVPGDSTQEVRENEVVFIKVYVTDPNGDENIDQVDVIASDARVPKGVLKENSMTQREFAWTPGYDFVDETEKKRETRLTFFAMDKSDNRAQRKVRVVVTDTENLEAKDQVLTQKYVGSLATARNLIMLLDNNNQELERVYNKARKGKKSRTVVNASLGAMTGLSPLVLEPDPAKSVTVIGGTSVLTLNSLEAGQVIGKNASDFQNKIRINRDLRTQLQLKGNYFARKYALKSTRRNAEFEQDRDDISRLMNSEALATLGISAAAQSAPSPKEIKKTFSDFSEE